MIPMKHLMFVVLVLVLVTLRICQAISVRGECPDQYLDPKIKTYDCTCYVYRQADVYIWDILKESIVARGEGRVTFHINIADYETFGKIHFKCVSKNEEYHIEALFSKAPSVTASVEPAAAFCLRNVSVMVTVTCKMNISTGVPPVGILHMVNRTLQPDEEGTIKMEMLLSETGSYPVTCVATNPEIKSQTNEVAVEINAYSYPQFTADGEDVHNQSMIYVNEDIGCFVDSVPMSMNLTCGDKTVTSITSEVVVFPVNTAGQFRFEDCECRVEFDHNVRCSSNVSVKVNATALASRGSNVKVAAMLDICVWFLTALMTSTVFFVFTQVE